MSFRKVLRFQVPVLLWMLAILTLSSIPTIPMIKFPISPDKLGHMGIYFVLCLLWNRALFHQNAFPFLRKHSLLMSFCLTAVHGILDEVYQMSVPGRSAEFFDALADAMGAGLFVLGYWWRARRINRTI